MNKEFSIYLEVSRIIATLIVFVAHGSIFYMPFNEYNEILKLGRDGVIVFFVLSGFVITYCANERDKSLLDFTINRASRIYSVAIPALVLGAITSLFVSYYTNQDISYAFYQPWVYLPMYLTFTGNFWYLSEVPPGNFPYWSLNYEVWFYIIFAAFFYLKGAFRWLTVFILFILVGPVIIQLFPLWIMGSLIYHLRNKIKLSINIARVTLVFTLCLFIVTKIYAVDNILDQYNIVLWKFLFNLESAPDQLLGDYFLGIIVFINFIAAYNARINFNANISAHIRYIASFSFSIYLFHIPLFSIFKLWVTATNSLFVYLSVLTCTSILIMFLARYTEHRKGAYRSFFRTLWRYYKKT